MKIEIKLSTNKINILPMELFTFCIPAYSVFVSDFKKVKNFFPSLTDLSC